MSDVEPHLLRPTSLSTRLTRSMVGAMAASMAVFAIVAWLVVTAQEAKEAKDPAHAGQIESATEVRDEVLIAMAFAAPMGLLLAAGGAWLLTRRALAPIERVIDEATAITSDHLDQRLTVPESDREVRALVVALNGLLGRLQVGQLALASFVADASHELRTPLAVLLSELEVSLRRPRSPAQWQETATTSIAELRRLSRLVDALLRLTRAGTDDTTGRADVELRSLLAQELAIHADMAQRAAVTLTLANNGVTATVRGDTDALSSAVGNLIGNALRYTPRGGRVDVALWRRGALAVIDVRDTGDGLRDDEFEKLFTPFWRGRAGQRADEQGREDAPPPGLGLGLAMAARIVGSHGGVVRAVNRADGGACFTIDLPAIET